MSIFQPTDLYEAKKHGNIALRKVENPHDPKYKLEKQCKFDFRKVREESHSMRDE